MTLDTYLRSLEAQLTPVVASLVAWNAGGRDSNQRALPGLPAKIAHLPQDLAAIAAWSAQNAPWCARDQGAAMVTLPRDQNAAKGRLRPKEGQS